MKTIEPMRCTRLVRGGIPARAGLRYFLRFLMSTATARRVGSAEVPLC